jgi:hypothetical protein
LSQEKNLRPQPNNFGNVPLDFLSLRARNDRSIIVQKKSTKTIAAVAISALVVSTNLASALPISGAGGQPGNNIISVRGGHGGHHHGGHHFRHRHHGGWGGGWGGWDDWGWGPWVGLGILGLGLAAAASQNYNNNDCWRQPNGRLVCNQ